MRPVANRITIVDDERRSFREFISNSIRLSLIGAFLRKGVYDTPYCDLLKQSVEHRGYTKI